MSNPQIHTPRISEDPANYAAVFNSARATTESVRTGQLQPNEATAMARNDTIAERILQADLKARLVEHRLAARTVNEPQQIESSPAPKAA
ncbi:hypothetical protein ATO13_22201 [Stappia sp. 22II-S9-Z10]|nr:hypothetical protein ATO13_22201 [Stappia sp. 22II-S9-Z10]